jgi:hypothetical protein
VTSLRQWAANRENAKKSTGLRSEDGKRRSRRNAFRHGLTAQTVVDGLEDPEDYRAFEATIIADYDAHTAVERELVLRLASLLWRIRRATGIETDLLRIQAEIISEREQTDEPPVVSSNGPQAVYRMLRVALTPPRYAKPEQVHPFAEDGDEEQTIAPADGRRLTHSFLRLANLDNAIFDRLARYEAALWKQIVQTLIALEPLRRHRYRFG